MLAGVHWQVLRDITHGQPAVPADVALPTARLPEWHLLSTTGPC